MLIEGSMEQRGLLTRVRMRLCEAGFVKAVFKKDYLSEEINQDVVTSDIARQWSRAIPYSVLTLAYSTVAFAGDGGSDASSAQFVIKAVTMMVSKLIDLF
jgi:hypothetical protein